MNYKRDVLEDAVDFLEAHEEEIKDTIVDGMDFDHNDINCLDEDFHQEIVDRDYTPGDAVLILKHCENEETDSGIWEGQQPEDAIRTKAAFCYGNDVWFQCVNIYENICEKYNEIFTDLEVDEQDSRKARAVEFAWKEIMGKYRTPPQLIVPKSKEEKERLERWLSLGESAWAWKDYPMGGSYIDARCGSGHGMPNIKDYVDFDQETGKMLPHLRGKYRDEIIQYLKDNF